MRGTELKVSDFMATLATLLARPLLDSSTKFQGFESDIVEKFRTFRNGVNYELLADRAKFQCFDSKGE